MPPSDRERIPLTVIGGFLGAGKTTYLNALIREGVPEDSLIVVNDFGDINIDAELIDYRDDRILQLSNGCICCTLGGTLAEQLAAILRLPALPGAVFIEASGVADPARIGDIARVSRRFELSAVICLVDGSQALRHVEDRFTGDIWRAQIGAASRLLLNRLPAKGGVERAQVLQWLEYLNPSAMPEIASNENDSWLSEKPLSQSDINNAPRHDAPSPKSAWHSFSQSTGSPIDAKRLEALLSDYADVLLRAKGFLIRQDRTGVQVLQLSGGRISWQPTLRPPGGLRLVCIGLAGERLDALSASLQQLDADAALPCVNVVTP